MGCGGAGLGMGCGGAGLVGGCGAGLAATNSFRFMLHPTTKNGRRLPLTLGGECRGECRAHGCRLGSDGRGDRTWWAPWRVHTGRPVRVRCRVRFLLALVPFPAAVAVDPAAPLWAWCRPMFRLAPVLLMMAAVASGAAADPACLPDCNGENLIGHDLRFANMAGASLRGAALTLANAARADLSGADLSYANLALADLEEADLSEAKLYGATLAEANMEGANLSGADLQGASLISADLVGANLTGADLRNATLYGADLSSADLSGANLTRAGLRGADLSFAKLNDADLTGADLRGADLTRANLSSANLFGADLSDVVGWSTVTLEGVRGCDTATEPRPLLPGC